MVVSGVCPGRIICRIQSSGSPWASPEKLLEDVVQFTRCTAVTADGTLWAWGSDRPAMLRDGLVDPEDPYDTEACDGIVRITNGVVCAVPCSDRTLAVLADGSLWQFPSAGFLPEWETSPDRSPAAPEKLLDQVRMPSPSPAWAADAPPPAVLKSASLEAWEARQADAADAEMGPDSLPVQEESPAKRTGGQENPGAGSPRGLPPGGCFWRPGYGAERSERCQRRACGTSTGASL